MSESTSETIDDGGPAFPAMLPGGNYCTPGMSLRMWFAGLAMQALIQRRETSAKAHLAEEAFLYADGMLNYIEKEQ